MNAMLAPVLLLCASSFAAPAAVDPGLARALAQDKAAGFAVERTITDTVKGLKYSVVLLRHAQKRLERLEVYAHSKDKTFLVYLHPSSVDHLEFSRRMISDQEFTNLLRDGSKTIAYIATTPGLNKQVLYILRCGGGKVRRVGAFPEGRLRDIDEDGRMEIISRSMPLGRFFSAGCEDFQTLSQSAYETRIYRWSDGRFADVSAKFPDFYADDIAKLEERLALIPKEKRPGDYLGASLTLYYDYAAKDAQRKGWERLQTLLKPPIAVPRVKACLDKVTADLRRQLEIPADW